MNYKKLKSLSRDNFQNNGSFAVILFVFAGILITGLCMIDLLLDDILIFLIIVPLLVLPILFSFTFVLLHKNEITKIGFREFVLGYKYYFSEHFSSSFSFFKTFFLSILLYLIFTILSLLAIILPMYNADVLGFKAVIDEFAAILSSNYTLEMIEEFLSHNLDSINIIVLVNSILPFVVVSLYSTYQFSINSISIFLRNDFQNYSGKYLKSMNASFVKEHKRDYLLADFYLNWPFYLGFILFFALGGYLGSLFELYSVSVFTLSLSVALFAYIGIFGSFRYANKLAVYQYFKDEYRLYDIEFQNRLISRFNATFLSSINNVEQDDEDTKKDSEES